MTPDASSNLREAQSSGSNFADQHIKVTFLLLFIKKQNLHFDPNRRLSAGNFWKTSRRQGNSRTSLCADAFRGRSDNLNLSPGRLLASVQQKDACHVWQMMMFFTSSVSPPVRSELLSMTMIR